MSEFNPASNTNTPEASEPERVCLHPDAGLAIGLLEPGVRVDLPVITDPPSSYRFQVVWSQGLALKVLGLPAQKPLRVDFVTGRNAHRRRFGGGRQQAIARACGLNRRPDLVIHDATAGFGRDSFVLASLGARVILSEAHPVLAMLLADGLRRVAQSRDPELQEIGARMQLQPGPAERSRGSMDGWPAPDILYLDPMFPVRQRAAAVKADMQALHRLVGAPTDAAEHELITWARTRAGARVVVKRPRQAPDLAGQSPTYRLPGKTNRFDVYVRQGLDALTA